LRRSTTDATVDAFWPMATYTQMTPCPFWLMIVSIATAVFPSAVADDELALPRPIGIIESMALIPVCSGSFTG
jgi:hypothetical protein